MYVIKSNNDIIIQRVSTDPKWPGPKQNKGSSNKNQARCLMKIQQQA